MGHSPFIDTLYNLFQTGGEWVLFVLAGLGVLSIGVFMERLFFYMRRRVNSSGFGQEIVEALNAKDIDAALELRKDSQAPEVLVVREGLVNFTQGRKIAKEMMDAQEIQQIQEMDRYTIILGTIGSNAPYVGLLGTVLGIIKAFSDLALNSAQGPSVVMAGISEALVATAVGLLVAIPSVIFYNWCRQRQKTVVGNIDRLRRIVLASIQDKTEPDSGSEKSSVKVAS